MGGPRRSSPFVVQRWEGGAMTVFAIRVFIFTVLPVLAAAVVARLGAGIDSRERRLEVALV